MRFKASVRNIQRFTKFTASLSSIGKVAWVRLDDNNVRFTIIPEKGSQVWAALQIDSIFEEYTIQSAAENNTINLELPLPPLQRALRSAVNATSASLRLTKKDGQPVLSLTISTSTSNHTAHQHNDDPFTVDGFRQESLDMQPARETIITQNIPIRVLTAESVDAIHEPIVREPEVNITLPPLVQLKAVSDRFTKLATATSVSASSGFSNSVGTPKLELKANMFGTLKLSIATDALDISSVWTGLQTPGLDPSQFGPEGLANHPTTLMSARGPDAFATVRIDGRDWSKVLSVGRMGGRVIACFVDEHALILYVYLSSVDDGGDDSVLTYYISSFAL